MASVMKPQRVADWRCTRKRCAWVSAALVAPLLMSCAALPRIDEYPASNSVSAVPIVGTHGSLASDGSALVIEKGQTEPAVNFDRHLAREAAFVGSPLTKGNSVRLLKDGPATYAAMLAAIHAARDHINLETFILDDDAVGRHFADALISRQQQGVQVNLIYDSVGAINTPREFFQRLQDSGIRVLEFNPVNPVFVRSRWNINQRDHRKLLIVDGRIAFLGGINISSVYSGGSARRDTRSSSPGAETWRDTHLELQGPVVEELQRAFLKTWREQHGEPLLESSYFPGSELAGRHVVRTISSSPEATTSAMYATLLSAIDSAQTTVHLTNAYFVPDPRLLQTLKAAVGRGVTVRLILPGKSDSRLVFHAGRSFYRQLLLAGVEIYERQDVILHAKTALVDGVWATIGSTNLDWRSFIHNYELDAVVLGTDFGLQMQAMFDIDLAGSRRIVIREWQRRPWHMRLQESFARLWEYWL